MTQQDLIEGDLKEKAKEQEQKELRNLEKYHWLKENGYILFESIIGSQAHGTNTETSDIDKAFVYILPEDDILGIEYKEQLKIHKDFMGYEIRRFLELLRSGNPTILELLNSPEDCVLIKHPSFDFLLSEKEKFITKACENSFYGYARQQRTKAEGLEKLQNWEVNRVVKKNPIDFCYVLMGYDAIPFTTWLERKGLDQKFCGLAAVNHSRDIYAVFYDKVAHDSFSELVEPSLRDANKNLRKENGLSMGLGYKGVAFEDSNDIRLSNIPKEEREEGFLCHISYNKDGYAKHCKDYKRYQDWLVNRNETRWVEIKGHGQQIDGKNMMHFMRLVIIGREIAQGKGIQIRRPDAQELLKIRRGEVSLRELFDKSDEILNEMKLLFQTSNLPEEVSREYVHELLVKIRKSFYKNYPFHEEKNLESNNPFILKAYNGSSELHSFINDKIHHFVNEYYMDGVSSLDTRIVMSGFVLNSNRWPLTKVSGADRMEKVSTENFSVLKITRDKITVMAGGDWQDPIQFDVVLWQDTLAAINIKLVDEWDEGISNEEFFKTFGHEYKNEDED